MFASASSARHYSARDIRKRSRCIRDAGRHHCKFRVERDTVRGSTDANDQPIAPQGASFRSSARGKRLVMCTVHTEQYSITVKLWRMPRGLITSPRTGQRLRSATVSHWETPVCCVLFYLLLSLCVFLAVAYISATSQRTRRFSGKLSAQGKEK